MSELFSRVDGIDLSRPLTDADFERTRMALGRHGVICFPDQTLTSRQLYDFSGRFGTLEVNVGGMFQDPELPEVMILSNIVRDGKPIGIGDAGQDWHTDMSYSKTVAFANVLYGIEIPVKDGRPLGNTNFADQAAAWDDLPADVKARLEGRIALHDFAKFWDMMRSERNSPRPPLTDEQRRKKPPVHHPVHFRHPLSGRTVLYANPGYTVRIEGIPQAESDELLQFLFAHQVQPKYVHSFSWKPGDVLMWDNLRVIHKAVADYGPDTPRHIKRCQVMADRVFGAHPI
ncbi:MAG: TauD/TfdA dioxygenase family protein [Lautropia sp.]